MLKIIREIRDKRIKYCIHCDVAEPSAELRGIECKTRNLLGVKVRKHVFRL